MAARLDLGQVVLVHMLLAAIWCKHLMSEHFELALCLQIPLVLKNPIFCHSLVTLISVESQIVLLPSKKRTDFSFFGGGFNLRI